MIDVINMHGKQMSYSNKKTDLRYLQLKNWIIAEIKRGNLKEGNKLSTQRELMDKYSLSYSTVATALRELTEEKYIYRKHGSGTFVGSRLDKGKIYTIGVMHFLFASEDFLTMPVPAQMLQGIYDEVQSLGWNMMISSYNYEKPEIPMIIENNLVDGLIFTIGLDKRVKNVVEKIKGIPFVLAGNYVNGENWPAIVPDNVQGIKISIEHLLMLGHKNIAYIQIRSEHAGYLEKYAEYEKILRRQNFFRPEFVITANSFQEAFNKITPLLNKITAICFAGDDWYPDFMEYGKQYKIKVPEDISIIGFDDVPLAAKSNPPLTTVRIDRNLLGRTAVRELHKMMVDRIEKPEIIRIPVKLMVRGTTGKVKET